MSVAMTRFAGSTPAFLAALSFVVLWAATGPLFGFSPTWQLVINTGTTIVTFLMVFLIQRGQNKESQALHLKLNELLAAMRGASSRLLNLEDHSEEELRVLHRHYRELARLAREEGSLTDSHSIEEAEARHRAKRGRSAGEPTST
jgi:low affinity Fe/Cu permease